MILFVSLFIQICQCVSSAKGSNTLNNNNNINNNNLVNTLYANFENLEM